MNTTETGEPLGENPEIPLLPPAADEVLATKQLAERQGSALSKIRARAHEALKYPRSQAYHAAVLREVVDLLDEAGL